MGKSVGKNKSQTGKAPKRRSKCPLNIALEVLGDSWTLLIMRDILFKGFGTFKEFRSSMEGVATNILADRLKKMTANGLITASRSNADRRVMLYRPTQKGLDLAPVMLAMILWTDKYEDHVVPAEKISRLTKDGDKFIAETLAKFNAEAPTRFDVTLPDN